MKDKKQKRKEELILAATRVFANKGYHNTAISDIVKEAGVSQGTFYNYFKSKRDAFESLINQLINEFYNTFSTFPIKKVENMDEYINAQRLLAKKAIQVITKRREMARILFWESIGLDRDFNQRIMDIQNLFIELSTMYINHGISIGIVREGINPEMSAIFVISGLWNLAFRWLYDQYSIEDVTEQINAVLDDHFYGILKK